MRDAIRAKLLTARQQRQAREAEAARRAAQPPSLRKLHPGQRVRISGPPGDIDAIVLHVETPANLPSISGAPEIDQVRTILAGRDVQQLALISHRHEQHQACFCALTDGRGRWWDLQQQELSITEARP